MIIGITGNTGKDQLWEPVADLIRWLDAEGHTFRLNVPVAEGLYERELVEPRLCIERGVSRLADEADVIFSFGGDGTFLNSAHEVGTSGTPLLGVNIGRLGFLADVEVGQVREAVTQIQAGHYSVESRLVLRAELQTESRTRQFWALNEFVIERGGPIGMISVDVYVDGAPLNTYWADGLILATPTGSTAYSLSVGGPIVMPGADVVILIPLAPHTLTLRPIVLPASSIIEAHVEVSDQSYVLAADGRSAIFQERLSITVCQAEHRVNLIKLPGQHYFKTLRSKLMWGQRKEA